MRRTGGAGIMLLLLLFALLFALPAFARNADVLINQRLEVDGDLIEFSFSAPSNNLYALRYFGAPGALGTLYQAGVEQPVARGEGFNFSARLISGARYRLVVENGGGGAVEIMRDALGRSFDRPIQLSILSDGYDKVIARAYDTHWYRFTAPDSGTYVLTTGSEIDTTGYLFDAQGRQIAFSDDAYPPYERNFRLEAVLTAGESYCLRVSAEGDETGAYHLSVVEPSPAAPALASILLSEGEARMTPGAVIQLSAQAQPEGARADIAWISTDQAVARVTPQGEVIAVAPGACDIVAYFGGHASATCRVTVESIPLQEVHFELDELELPRKQSAPLAYAVMPPDASDQRMLFGSSDESIASVDAGGVVTGVGEGRAQITVTAADGGYQSSLTVAVTRAEPAYRALLMGEQRYLDGRLRTGSVNTTQGMADLLAISGAPGGYKVTMKFDNSRAELVRALQDAFRDAEPTDVSLFYINCHGGYDSGRAWLELHDGSRITAAQLERMLRKIPGTVIVMIDCCQSGAFLSGTAHYDFNRGVLQAFSRGAGTSFALSKYRVMTSSSSQQDSYRISFAGPDSEAAMATVFVRSLCEAGGWDLIKDRKATMRADLDKDRIVTFEEAYRYTRRRVKQYLRDASVQQDVQVFPAGATLSLFKR